MSDTYPVTTHLFACPDPAAAWAVLLALQQAGERYPWREPQHWGLKAGLLAPTLVLAETTTRTGTDRGLADHVTAVVPGVRVVQACVEEDLLRGPDTGPGLVLGFNYVVAFRRHDVPAVAATLDGARVLVAGYYRDLWVLCLPEVAPLRIVRGSLADAVMQDDGLGRLLYAFATADAGAAGQRSPLLLGLHAPGLGWVHMLTLMLGLEQPHWQRTGTVDVADGARFNPMNRELHAGPNGLSSRFTGPIPVHVEPLHWPL